MVHGEALDSGILGPINYVIRRLGLETTDISWVFGEGKGQLSAALNLNLSSSHFLSLHSAGAGLYPSCQSYRLHSSELLTLRSWWEAVYL